MIIRAQQFSILDAASRDRSRERLVGWLRDHAEPARQMDDQQLKELIVRQDPRAAAYGVETEVALAKWCFLAVLTGERFDQLPEIVAFLSNSGVGSPERKMTILMRSLAYAAAQKERHSQ